MIKEYRENLSIDFSGWFIKLADFAERTDDNSSLPKLELWLHSGNIIRGRIIGYDRTRQEKLIMVLGISDYNPKSKITLVPGSQVAAITFVDGEKTLKTLKPSAVVSVLELKRTAKQVEEELQKSINNQIILTLDTDNYPENVRNIVFETLKFLPSIFESLIKDDLGKESVIENIKSIKISTTEKDTITLINKELHIEISAGFKFPSKEKDRIKKEIENVL